MIWMYYNECERLSNFTLGHQKPVMSNEKLNDFYLFCILMVKTENIFICDLDFKCFYLKCATVQFHFLIIIIIDVLQVIVFLNHPSSDPVCIEDIAQIFGLWKTCTYYVANTWLCSYVYKAMPPSSLMLLLLFSGSLCLTWVACNRISQCMKTDPNLLLQYMKFQFVVLTLTKLVLALNLLPSRDFICSGYLSKPVMVVRLKKHTYTIY